MKLSRKFALRFCETLAQSDQALFKVLEEHPEFPKFKQLCNWRERNPWFAAMWRKAREEQGEHLAQKCLDIAAKTTPQNAHQRRVQYDIYKWVASRFAPATYGDRPVAPQTNIAVGVTISTERLNEIRNKLSITRAVMLRDNSKGNDKGNDKPSSNGDTPDSEGLRLQASSRK
jgi:hypothetical protein